MLSLHQNATLHIGFMPDAEALNQLILEQFNRAIDDPDTRKTHLFEGRYENIYIDRDKIPALSKVLESAKQYVAEISGVDRDELRCGFWFNQMQPGQVTIAHTHDDADEIMSGTYYIVVPEHSGNLVIKDPYCRTIVTPEPGRFVFFKPDVLHEVTRNESHAMRLSIGMNFGLQQTAD